MSSSFVYGEVLAAGRKIAAIGSNTNKDKLRHSSHIRRLLSRGIEGS